MGIKTIINAPLSRFGYVVSRKTPKLVDFIDSRNVDVVFDVGANVGQFAKTLRSDGYTGRIVSFEPVSKAFEQLQNAASSDPAWTAYKVGLGANPGKTRINVSANTVFSSMMPLSEYGTEFDRASMPDYQEEILIDTVDNFIKEIKPQRSFLKIDTQGFERNVLEGIGDVDRIVGIQLELPIVHLYDGVWDVAEAIQYMQSRGFLLSILTPAVRDPADDCAVIEFDCIFRRA